MQNRPPADPNAQRLADPKAARLLARASELDASSSAVADLRAAAAEAGISAQAFDAALAEMQGEAEEPKVPAVPAPPHRRFRMGFLTAAMAAVIVVGFFAVMRMAVPTKIAAAPGTVVAEESILLRCLSPAEAGDLRRPVARDHPTTVISSPAQGSRVLNIRATPEALQAAKALLDRYEAPGAPSCRVTPVTPAPPVAR